VKKLAVKYYLENTMSQKDVAEIFDIYVRTFQRWIYNYQNVFK